jgi:thiamine pyrophosphate-dependent acetolactate synthase large subunit-like protein
MQTAADELVNGISRLGAEDIWALGAAKVADVLDAARRHPELQVRGASTEKDAVCAADGAARVHGVGVAAFIGSVGLTSAAVGVQTLVLEGTPVLLLIGQTDPAEPPGSLQDTRLSDAAVLQALGCATWEVHSAQDLPTAWEGVVAELGQSRPAALLIDECALRQPWTAPLHADRRPARQRSRPAVADHLAPDMTRLAIWQALRQADPDAAMFADAGQARQALLGLSEHELIHQCPRSASLGWAVPAAMGAATNGRVYAVCGDGGFMMSLAALATIGHLGLPVTTVVAVNGILGVDSARTRPVPDDLRIPAVDIVRVVEAMNVPATVVDTPQKLVATCDQQGPQLIVTRVPAFEPIPQRVP